MNDTYMGAGTTRTMDWTSFNWFGLFFLLLGVAWLGDNMAWWAFNWSMVGPLALIFAGVMLFISRRK
jgi:hypothetical protein